VSDEKPAETKTKKKGKGKLIMLVAIALVVGGAGAAGGLYAAGFFSHEETGPKEDPNKPVLVLKGETAEEIAAAHGSPSSGGGEGGGHGEGGGGGGASHGASSFHVPPGGIDLPTPKDPANYQATYFQIPAPFTTNLVDTDSFAQISIAVGTYYDARIIQAMQMHETAIRSAILMMLAQEQEIDLSTPRGKEELQAKLKKTINTILKQKTGYGGVDNVYFTNFVIQ
jgi:flagellar FliL protein